MFFFFKYPEDLTISWVWRTLVRCTLVPDVGGASSLAGESVMAGGSLDLASLRLTSDKAEQTFRYAWAGSGRLSSKKSGTRKGCGDKNEAVFYTVNKEMASAWLIFCTLWSWFVGGNGVWFVSQGSGQRAHAPIVPKRIHFLQCYSSTAVLNLFREDKERLRLVSPLHNCIKDTQPTFINSSICCHGAKVPLE